MKEEQREETSEEDEEVSETETDGSVGEKMRKKGKRCRWEETGNWNKVEPEERD